MQLIFDPARHTYSINGITLPSITTILLEVGLVDTTHFTDYARERGTAVHKACHYFDEGDLDEGALDPVIRPYLEAWKSFRCDTGYTPTVIEKPLAESLWGYAGTPDRAGGLINGKMAVVEIKTGQISPVTGLQLAAQQKLLEKIGLACTKRYAVHLRDDGTYKMVEYADRKDWDIFLAALAVVNWKRNHSKGGHNGN